MDIKVEEGSGQQAGRVKEEQLTASVPHVQSQTVVQVKVENPEGGVEAKVDIEGAGKSILADIPSFGVDIVPSMDVHRHGVEEKKLPAVEGAEGTAAMSSSSHDAILAHHQSKSANLSNINVMSQGSQGRIAVPVAGAQVVMPPGPSNWRSTVSNQERTHMVGMLYSVLKSRYKKELDDRMKRSLVALSRRVEDAWFSKAESKEQYSSKAALTENFSKLYDRAERNKRPREEMAYNPAQSAAGYHPQVVQGGTVPGYAYSTASSALPRQSQPMPQYGTLVPPHGIPNNRAQYNGFPHPGLVGQPINMNGAYPQIVNSGQAIARPFQYQQQMPLQPNPVGTYQNVANQQVGTQGQYMSNGAPLLIRGGMASQASGMSGMGQASQPLYMQPISMENQMVPIENQQRQYQMVPVESGEQVAESTQKNGLEAILTADQKEVDPDVRKEQITKQQRWLLFLRHCAKCTAPPGECQYKQTCAMAKKLWDHLISCKDEKCQYPRCAPSRELLQHHQRCRSKDCPVCVPVKHFVAKQREAMRSKKLAMSGLTEEQQRAQIQQMQIRRAELAKKNQMGQPYGSMGDLSNPIIDTDRRPRLLLNENMGTSLIEYFTAKEIEDHMAMLTISDAGNNKPSAPNRKSSSSALDGLMPLVEEESQCKLCNQNRLLFEPQALYCYCCGIRIKRNQSYYASPPGCDIRATWCHTCYASSAEKLMLESFTIEKQDLEKKKNDSVSEEPWVQCDNCEGWVHQICGLFNKGRNDDSRGFLCPECLLSGIRTGKRKIPETRPQAMLTAKDLPKCRLSDVLEERIQKAFQKEKEARSKELGIDISQVEDYPEVTVRVVNNVEKKVEVTPLFAKEFCINGRSDAYLYKQKVILLFQKIDGVDMCLYCLYVQEYGDDCPAPNNRTVYLSYLDSVKYFRPDGVQASGMGVAMRTYIYHELLIGYVEDVKKRGFCAMYIWACPPLQGDDYIFYCHPGKQKVPRSDRLREWYLSMLKRSQEERSVVYISNLVDTFFEGGKDHRIENPSVTDLPYFAGDYWPGEAEKHLVQEDPSAAANATKRKGQKEKRIRIPEGAGPGQIVLAKLAEYSEMQKMKADFLVAHLYESCSHCRVYINGANRYYHPNPPQKVTIKSENVFDGISLDKPGTNSSKSVSLTRFQLCETCYKREQGQLDEKPLGLPLGITLEELVEDACPIIPPNVDEDPTMDSEFFDTRQQFLSLCQGNHYQFDTLRRARHSSMMSLYHLHNPSEPAFSASCNICQTEVPPGEGYRCQKCPDFDMCRNCHSNPQYTHPHPLIAPEQKKFDETQMRLTREEKKRREEQMKVLMRLLVHAAQCEDANCPNVNCGKIKNLFRHAATCRVGVTGKCPYCRKAWVYVQLHAKLCTSSNCPVPRCTQIRALRRQQAARQEAKRRDAYRRMMDKQQASTG